MVSVTSAPRTYLTLSRVMTELPAARQYEEYGRVRATLAYGSMNAG